MSLPKVNTGLRPYENASLQKAQKQRNATQKGTETEVQKERDTVSLSSEAKLLAAGLQEAQKAPEIRQEKVDELKQQIASNSYTLNTRSIATKMVDELIEIWK